MHTVLSLIARICLAGIFLGSAVNKMLNTPETVAMMAKQGVPAPNLMILGAIAFLLVGGISVVLGLFTRIGTLLLMIFLVLATYFFHDFWTLEGAEARQELIAFQKNVGLFGGLLFLFANGPGLCSLDRRRIVRRTVVVEEPALPED